MCKETLPYHAEREEWGRKGRKERKLRLCAITYVGERKRQRGRRGE